MNPLHAVGAAVRRLRREFGFFRRRLGVQWFVAGVELGPGVRLEPGVELRATDGGRIVLGRGVFVGRGTILVAQRAEIRIGDDGFVGAWCQLTAKQGIVVGRDALIAERVSIRDQDHAIKGGDDPIRLAGFDVASIAVGDDVWIGAGAVVLRGTRIGDGAVVAANAVVNRDVAAREIVGGVPARTIGGRDGG